MEEGEGAWRKEKVHEGRRRCMEGGEGAERMGEKEWSVNSREDLMVAWSVRDGRNSLVAGKLIGYNNIAITTTNQGNCMQHAG